MEIPLLSFAGFHSRLLEELRRRVHNGDITERSLARKTGISQPHVHNVLKGVRTLSPELADVLLLHLRISLLDLIPREDLLRHLANTSRHKDARLQPVPVLCGMLGLHQPIPRKSPHREVHSVPLHLTETATDPLIATLAFDPEMDALFAAGDLVLLDQSEAARANLQPEGYYVVKTPEGACVRALHHSGGSLHLISERTRNDPARWQQLSLAGASILDLVLARVVWLNRRRRWEDHVA